MPTYLRPTNEIHPDALLPSDPGVALALAQELIDQPKMSNHARGLWGYSGLTPDGRELTIQSTGIGGPSAAVVLSELAELGVRRAVRIGTCEAIVPDFKPGDLIAVSEAIAADGVSRELGAADELQPDAILGKALEKATTDAGGRAGGVLSADLPHGFGTKPPRARAPRAATVDTATAALFALGAQIAVEVAALLVVSEALVGRIDEKGLGQASLRAGHAAVAALATVST
ncbi:MAG: hypothetical protein AABM29_09910 [Actinomycetota bacterium]